MMARSKSFTARSLVGMTMGARKRRWAKDYDALPQSGRAAKTVSMLRAYGIYPKEGNPLAQKLRPCAGCIRCECQTAFDVWPKLGEALAKDLPTCDGSGVLPARKEKS